ncbi:MAG: sigma-70 family RNA polymerase sigma factor [Sedimentisphaerales bacterium]|nr:sigma-70 family RNA polymerase sigma factor [Sedimentisphaerales bacterium]
MTESSRVNEFLRLIMANQKPIYALILGLIPNREDAEDIFQETVLVMWSKFDSFEQGTNFAAWGVKIAKYKIFQAHRRNARNNFRFSQAAFQSLQDKSDNLAKNIERRMQALRTCIRKLSKTDYDLIQMRYENEFTIKSIADRLGRTVQSIYKRMARINDSLIRCIRRTLATEELT